MEAREGSFSRRRRKRCGTDYERRWPGRGHHAISYREGQASLFAVSFSPLGWKTLEEVATRRGKGEPSGRGLRRTPSAKLCGELKANSDMGLLGRCSVSPTSTLVANALPPQKIVGGSTATLGEFPYQVSLRLRGSHLCGGAIVGPRHIVTAAHCVVGTVTRPYTNFRIATGSLSSWGGTTHAVSKVTPHPGYRNENEDSRHDIAVIELAEAIKFNKHQNKIDLPKAATRGGVTATATGWGAKSAKSAGLSYELLKVNVKTLDPSTCDRYFRGANVRNDHVCTLSGYGLGTCQGDSGGPLAYNGELIGVVSFGIPCAVGYPDVFAGVYHYVDWIKRTMGTQ